MPQITFRITDEQEQKGKQLAMQKGLDDNIHQFSKGLFLSVLSGETEVVVMSADVDLIKARYEAKMELLDAQNKELLNRLEKANESSSLNGLENKQRCVASLINEALEKERQKNYVSNLEKENADFKADNKAMEKRIEELEQVADSEAKMQRWVETGGKVLESVHRVNPRAAERLTNGLSGFLGMPTNDEPAQLNAAPQLTETEQHAMAIGTGIQKSFGEQSSSAIRLLKYFAGNLPELTKFLNQSKVTTYFSNKANGNG